MEQHHLDSITNITNKLQKDPDNLALLIGGSIAHGFAKPNSDVDIMIVISEESYAKRLADNQLHYYETESCTYEGGYVDGKYITRQFMEQVAEKGSEPARFAFESARIAYSQLEDMPELLSRIVRYPVQEKQERIRKFMGQLEAWNWYCYEAMKHDNTYLLNQAITSLVLFGGRLILAHNEQLYPYHKWFLKVLEGVPSKPEGLMAKIDTLLQTPSRENVEAFYSSVRHFTDWGVEDFNWPVQFMYDTELPWMKGNSSVEDI